MSLTILHAEDDRFVGRAVRAALEAEGWQVVTCADGAAVLNKLAGGTPYDLLIVDNHLPYASGLAVVRYARSLPQRKHVPVIMFTASECGDDARAAGADAYLSKPDDLGKLVETVAALTETGRGDPP